MPVRLRSLLSDAEDTDPDRFLFTEALRGREGDRETDDLPRFAEPDRFVVGAVDGG